MPKSEKVKMKVPKMVPSKTEEKALVKVEKRKLALTIIENRKLLKSIAKKISIAVICVIAVLYIGLMGLISTSVFYVSHLKNDLIQNGVLINGISVADMNKQEAINYLQAQLNQTLPETVSLQFEEDIFQIDLAPLELKFDVEKAAEEAYQIGRTQNVVKDLWDYVKILNDTAKIEATLLYDEKALNQALENFAKELPEVKQYDYEIQNDKLLIHKGKSGVGLNTDELKSKILENLENRKQEQIKIPTYEILPEEIDVEKIHEEVYKKPQDAYFTENPITIYEPIIGVDFDVEKAKNQIKNMPDLEEYSIDLNFTNPKVFIKDLAIFPHVLSTFSTQYVNNPNRTTNLMIASNKINGTIIMPGEYFSFNQVVGERTISEGYKNAAIFVNGEVEDGLAGGICQISSTLYDAVIAANLQIKERHNHSKLTSYLAGGKDATVVWGRYDFQFINNREYPIKIEMSVQNGLVTASIYGILSNEEYEINIESKQVGTKGVYVIYEAYKVYRQNGVEVKREFLSRDLYK